MSQAGDGLQHRVVDAELGVRPRGPEAAAGEVDDVRLHLPAALVVHLQCLRRFLAVQDVVVHLTL